MVLFAFEFLVLDVHDKKQPASQVDPFPAYFTFPKSVVTALPATGGNEVNALILAPVK